MRFVVVPLAVSEARFGCNNSVCGITRGFYGELFVRLRCKYNTLEACCACGYACHCLKHPCGDSSVGVVIERIHADIVETVVLCVRIYAFPDRSSTLIYLVEPRRIIVLEKEGIREITAADLCERRQKYCSTEEACL